jgi:hypothetical protein
MLNANDTIKALERIFAEKIQEIMNTAIECYERDGEVAIPVSVSLTKTGPGGQTDVDLEINLTVNRNEKPPPWKAERIRVLKKITMNPAQRALPGQEG